MDKRDVFYLIFLFFLIFYGLMNGVLSNEKMMGIMDDNDLAMSEAGCVDEDGFMIFENECMDVWGQGQEKLGLFSLLFIISLPLGLIGMLFVFAMLIWMVVDAAKREELSGGKKAGWIISFFIIYITVLGYYIDVKRKDWDPTGEQRKLFIGISIVAFILFMAAAFFGIFYGF